MRTHRVYCPQLSSSSAELSIDGQAAKHLINVLRIKPGQPVVLFDGNGTEYQTRVIDVGRQNVIAELISADKLSRESPLAITLVQGLCRSERMDWLLQKATELGVSNILPVNTQRSVVRLDAKRVKSRLAHWQGILTHACEQCGRNTIPGLCSPLSLTEALDQLDNGNRYFLDPNAEPGISDLPRADKVTLIVGPEGGFSDEERQLMNSHDVKSFRLGPRILRTETAGIAALAAIGVLWGDL